MPKSAPKRTDAAAAKAASKKPAPAAPAPARKPARKASAPRPAGAQPPTTAEIEAAARLAAERAFIEATIARGEAQATGPSGELPEGATHELVESTGPDVPPKVRRKRFSAA